jgi:ABC-type sugar transport system permease subunit
MNRTKLGKNAVGYLFLAPFLLGFLLFGLYSVLNTIWLSFTDATIMGGGQGHFIGLANFTRLFADGVFPRAVGNTWLMWILNFIPQIGFALLLAALLTDARLNIKAAGIWRAVFYLPNLLMPAAIAALFSTLFGLYGPVNQFMVRAGFMSQAFRFMEDIGVARGLVIFINWWMWFGQTMIIVMAGMTSIPIPLYEAAMVDGASGWQMFRSITLPLLKPILAYIFVTAMVGGSQMFDIPFLLTDGRGSPQNSIQTSMILMYLKYNSSKGNIGAAASVGVLVFIMTAIVAVGIFYFLGEREPAETKSAKTSLFKKNAKGSQA